MNMSALGLSYNAPAMVAQAQNDSNFKEDFLDFIGWGAERRAYERQLASSNTAYQRAVADMQAAGLNPYLAYQQGGAPSAVAMASRGHLRELVALVGSAFDLAKGVIIANSKLSNSAVKYSKQEFDSLYDNLDDILKELK